MARRQISVEQKLEYISAWKRSGLSKTEFCKTHKIAFSGFHSWLKKIPHEVKSPPHTVTPINLIDVTPVLEDTLPSSRQPSIVVTTASGSRVELYL